MSRRVWYQGCVHLHGYGCYEPKQKPEKPNTSSGGTTQTSGSRTPDSTQILMTGEADHQAKPLGRAKTGESWLRFCLHQQGLVLLHLP